MKGAWKNKFDFRMWSGHVVVADARHRNVPLFDPARTAQGHDARGLDADTLRDARKAMLRSITPIGWAGFAFNVLLQTSMIVLGAYGAYGMSHSAFARPGDWIAPSVYCLLAIVGLATAWSSLRRTHAYVLAKGFVACRCCASCGYSLRDLPEDPDSCTTCPECGSAWRFETGLAALHKELEKRPKSG